jgi:hypothetical protein
LLNRVKSRPRLFALLETAWATIGVLLYYWHYRHPARAATRSGFEVLFWFVAAFLGLCAIFESLGLTADSNPKS